MMAAYKRGMRKVAVIALLLLTIVAAIFGILFAIIGFMEMAEKSDAWKKKWWVAMSFGVAASVLGLIAIFLADPFLSD